MDEEASSTSATRTHALRILAHKSQIREKIHPEQVHEGHHESVAPYQSQSRLWLRILLLMRRGRISSRSLRRPTTSQGLLRLFMSHSHSRRTMNSRRRTSLSILSYNTTPCGTANRVARREKKGRGGQLTCTGSCAWPPAPKAIQGLQTEGSVWAWRGPKSTGTGEESARKGLKLAEYPD